MDISTCSSKFSITIESLLYEGTFLEDNLLGNARITFNPPSFLMYDLVCLLNWSTSLNGTTYKCFDSSSLEPVCSCSCSLNSGRISSGKVFYDVVLM